MADVGSTPAVPNSHGQYLVFIRTSKKMRNVTIKKSPFKKSMQTVVNCTVFAGTNWTVCGAGSLQEVVGQTAGHKTRFDSLCRKQCESNYHLFGEVAVTVGINNSINQNEYSSLVKGEEDNAKD